MHKIFSFTLLAASGLAFSLLLSSCSILNFSSESRDKELDQVYRKGKVSSVPEKKMGEKLVRALIENDSKAFLKELPENLVQDFKKSDFEKTRNSMMKELGEPVSYTFLRNMAHPVANISLWVIRFERTPAPETKTKEKRLVMEVLFRAVYGKVDGKDTLLSFNFY
ncbi:MAG: hypothetical protein J6S53_03285 [Lentisphaeria bacterium]|nr:hypothetical protein [Lentisphaeria bacterium]